METNKEKFFLIENLTKKLRERKLSLNDFIDNGHLKNNKEVIKFYISLMSGYFTADDHDWSQKPEDEKEIIDFFYHIKECQECQQKIKKYNLKKEFEKFL